MIIYDRPNGLVTVTADNGTARNWPMAEFEANPEACIAQTGNGITPPTPEPSTAEKLAALEKRNAALEAALNEKAVVTKEEVDAKEAADPKGAMANPA